MLCIHTAGQSSLEWRYVLENMPRHGYEVLVPDLPGHGRSMLRDWTKPVDDIHVYAEWCFELLMLFGRRNPVVVGCSIGGKVALDLALHHSRDLGGVIVCESSATPHPERVSGLFRSMEDAASPSRADRTYLGTMAAMGPKTSDSVRVESSWLHRKEDPIITNHDLIAAARWAPPPLWTNIACPVRLVVGSEDFYVPIDEVQETRVKLPRAELTVLEGVGHYPMEEVPEFSDLLAGWISEMIA